MLDKYSMAKTSKARADLMSIGLRIRELRGKERQDDFAPFLGIAQSQLSRIESGMLPPTVEVLLRLRERYRKSVDWILTGEG
jgi:transcriptional regulator with XRE-family HTH domain